ncbi:hypothetical protein [Candidatus Uabimicrobium sp. HlEnr_7]|uniref:hypothetical protein n=1 Tax=Candidatus Uabimicrobium helgolandensis TaxID=3095367 RepID=UPI0035580D0D
MKKIIPLILILILISGCFSSRTIVGQGVHKTIKEEYTQWYVLWGILPMGKAGSGIQLNEDIVDARVYVRFTAWDSLFNIFIGPFTSVGRNTVTIEK